MIKIAFFDRRTPTNFLHHVMSILQLNDKHIVKVLSFVNECRSDKIPDIFLDYYKVRETGQEIRNNRKLDILWTRTDLGLTHRDIKGARLWNMNFDTVNPLLRKKSFRKSITKYFVSKYIWLIRPQCVSSFSQPLWIYVLNQCGSVPFTRCIFHIVISPQDVSSSSSLQVLCPVLPVCNSPFVILAVASPTSLWLLWASIH